ncbi:DUF7344 domain-containing protein [Haladaptatus pallidirubidus]|uniref:DUF7344 domain-containing protein n=1 Tax=Haladaptatus pallidirubidus TaxID=1008152 RepID=UPI0036F1D121
MLADSQRHRLLAMLTDTGGTVSVDELTTRLVEHAQTNRSSTAASSAVGNSKQRLRIRLQHVHLPKLADCNLIKYDANAQTVTPTVSPTAEVMLTDLLASAK